jgi:hypothetical protein
MALSWRIILKKDFKEIEYEGVDMIYIFFR